MRRRLAVACTIACTIAGAIVTAAAPAAAASWTVVGPVSGATYGILDGVTCTSAASCFAVGVLDTPSTHTRLAERWNGTSWSVTPAADPIGAVTSQLSAASCTSPSSCFAVGQYATSSATRTLVERWNGSRWSVVASPNPAGASVSNLSDVACPSATVCLAVGDWFAGSADSAAESTLAERWDGTKWSIVTSPNRATALDSGLSGIACWSTSACFAVGHSDTNVATSTLVERWNGAKWSIVSSPDAPGANDSELASVACPSSTRCFAAGSGHGSLVERWNGVSWSAMTTPNPGGATGAAFTGIACPSTTRCFAAGDFFVDTKVTRLLETWNGTGWSIVTTPLPAGTVRSAFADVACVATTSCFAVGEYRLGPSRRPLIERYA